MRTHRVFPGLQPWAWRSALLGELVTAERLVAARIEPVTRGREPAAFIDLHFSDGARAITIPLIYVDLAQLDLRELDPLVFPHGLADVVSDANARDVIARVFPDLERRAMTGGFWAEEAIRYGDAAIFDAARERGFFGAAPLAVALPRIAATLYARRFAAGKHVLAYGPQALELAGFFSDVAALCAVIGEDAAARAWYGDFDAAATDITYDLAIGAGPAPVTAAMIVRTDAAQASGVKISVAAPLPADVMISFDPADGPPSATFSVETTREPFGRRQPDIDVAVTGGSAGRIGIVVRPDAATAPDADSDEAAALAVALGREGFTPEVFNSLDALVAFGPDLVHLFGVRPGGFARSIAEWASDQRKPLVVHALYESPSAGGYWGEMVAPYCFGYSGDDRSVSAYLEMLSRRAVEVDGVNAGTPFAPPIVGQADSERVLALADVVLVNSERERAVVEALRPRRPVFVVPPFPVVSGAAHPIGAWVGADPFILVHAPIRAEGNQLIVARAAADVGVAMVIAGPIADPAYAERLREFAPDLVRLLPEPDREMTATLYRTAAVVADVAWTTRGHGRLVTAAALGAAVVCSSNRWVDLPEIAHLIVDPADVRSIARGIGGAWDAAVRGDVRIQMTARSARERLGTAAAAVVASYAKIVQAL
jgi:hypothetical protein